MTRLQTAARLAAELRQRSREICKDNGCKGGEHNCGSYAYIDGDLNLLDVCLPDYFPGTSKPYAAVPLPWEGCGRDLIAAVEDDLNVG